jgi:hypothetical protein
LASLIGTIPCCCGTDDMLRATNLCIYLFVCFCRINCNKNHPGQCKTFEKIHRQKSRGPHAILPLKQGH